MSDEYDVLIKNNTWELVPRPSGVNIIRSMWIFCHKLNSDGSFERYKPRLVGDGKTQQLDVKNAFLHGDLYETVYMYQPVGFRDPVYPDHVCKLRKSLYDLKQAPELGGLFLSQQKYVESIIARVGMSSCKSSATPIDTKSKLSGFSSSPCEDPSLFRSLAGALQYLTFTRPNISYVVKQICLFMHAPMTDHMLALKRVATISRSSAEVEYRGVANVVSEACWLRNFLLELYHPLTKATIVYCDNVSAIYLSENPVQHQCTKRVEIDIHFVREKVARGDVRVLHVPSRYQIADIFSKGLPLILFTDFRDSLSVRPPPAPPEGLY
ncbi:hypothetical protein LIER_21146 [Lithospermum erythrorhizon]|uniref:Reverse transcriptase Ty1/copia-type domain-containing protein n=1 Tax=Lithospermum erythrorhizon TaxID=34254 RepID=A0AAV3QUV9_LITER